MAGIFGDAINSRTDFFRRLGQAQQEIRKVLSRLPNEPTLLSVKKQLDAIGKWTANGRRPTVDERKSLDMALRMFREFETTDDVEIHRLRKTVSGVNHYVLFWPDDKTAADPKNSDYLFIADVK